MMQEMPGNMSDSLSASMLMSYFQPEEEKINILRRNAILAANCMVLANYDPGGLENYYTDQIKVDWDKQLLVDTSTFDITNFFSKFAKGWVEPLTELDKTVIILDKICKDVFEKAHGVGQYLSAAEHKPPHLVETFEKAVTIALFVFCGMKRTRNTYTKHYTGNTGLKKGYRELQELNSKVDQWGQTLSDLFCRTIAEPCKVQFREDNEPIVVIGKSELNAAFPTKTMSLSDVNRYLISDQQYYESLYHLSIYDMKETCDYTNHQIKACEKTKLLVLTGRWVLNNWSGVLTQLDKTVTVLQGHCDRAKKDCEAFYKYFAKAATIDNDFKLMWQEEIEHIALYGMAGVKRMGATYNKRYANDPNHLGLQALNSCLKSLTWIQIVPE